MLSVLKLQPSSPLFDNKFDQLTAGNLVYGRRFSIRLRQRQLASLSVQSETASSSSEPLVISNLNSTVGSSSAPQLSQWTLTHRHIHILNFIACVAAISATWLFFSAIPTLLDKEMFTPLLKQKKAFRRAAESLEKLMDVTREELPDTMAAVRLSGMEISDLTMELSDIGPYLPSQGLTQGVRSSTRAVRLAEERLRQFSSMPQSATAQGLLVPMETRTAGPALAKKVRDLREGIVKGRQVLQMLFTLTRLPSLPGGRLPDSNSRIIAGSRITGTLFGYRKGRVSLSIQENPRNFPTVVVELALQTNVLQKEMNLGMVRIALECEKRDKREKINLLEEPLWTMYCNGKKNGYGVKREATEEDLSVMEILKPVSMGAGVLPGKSDVEGPDGEMTYMRAHFERVVKSKDAETLYMLSPDANDGPELSIFFVRI
uniref:Protein MIZU-KUSSEI 1 n=1 Tax=Solanum lycopersicum TaxID=4081 RepID=A0A3Q7GMA9_SOLLC